MRRPCPRRFVGRLRIIFRGRRFRLLQNILGLFRGARLRQHSGQRMQRVLELFAFRLAQRRLRAAIDASPSRFTFTRGRFIAEEAPETCDARASPASVSPAWSADSLAHGSFNWRTQDGRNAMIVGTEKRQRPPPSHCSLSSGRSSERCCRLEAYV